MGRFCAIILALAAFARALPAAAGSTVMPADTGIGRSVSPDLVGRYVSMFSSGKGAGFIADFGYSRGLPSDGSRNMLVLLIDFDDYPARPGDTPESISARIFGSAGDAPYESLSAYYRRSSFGKLNIAGEVQGWIRMGRRADVPKTYEGREELIKNALLSLKGVDLSKYDGNGDGKIDHLAVIWSGPLGEWGSFWWPVAQAGTHIDINVSGMGIGVYSWQGIANKWEEASDRFDIRALIHEVGHSLGLPDYYDYKPGVGPDGGLGYFDMMDGLRYDHNCFSKILLGWVRPTVVRASGDYIIAPSHISGACLMVVPPGGGEGPFGEFFLLENRRRGGNDDSYSFPGAGLVVWHVDARLKSDGSGFMYDNQETEHKLLKVMEADGKEEIERVPKAPFGPDDFYVSGSSLTFNTVPSSRLYDGTDSHIGIVSHGGAGSIGVTITLK